MKNYWRRIRSDWRFFIGVILKELVANPPANKDIPEAENLGKLKLHSVQVSDAHLALFWVVTLPKFEKGFVRGSTILEKAKNITRSDLELSPGNIDNYSFL